MGIDIVLIIVPKNIPANPKYLANNNEVPKFIADSNNGTYLSGANIPALLLNIFIDVLNPVK